MSDRDLLELISKESKDDILADLPEEPTKKLTSPHKKHHGTPGKSTTKKTCKRELSIWNRFSLKRKKKKNISKKLFLYCVCVCVIIIRGQELGRGNS